MKATIFFDLGNVLIFFDHQRMCQQVATLMEVGTPAVAQLMLQHGEIYEKGGISSATLHEQVCRMTQKHIDFPAFVHAMSNIFQPNPPVISLALELKKRGHPLFLLSNTCEAHFNFAKSQFEFLQAFDGFVLSYEVQARKPEKKIFQKALEIARCDPTHCFYVDDILDYVLSARSLHIDAEQYTNPKTLANHLSSRGWI